MRRWAAPAANSFNESPISFRSVFEAREVSVHRRLSPRTHLGTRRRGVRVEGGKGRERWRWSGWLKACDQVQLRVKVGMIMDDLIKTLIHKLGILQTRLYRSHKGQIMHHNLSTLLSTYSDVWSLWRVMLRCWTLQGSCQAYHQIHPNSPQASRGNICSATDL